MARDVDDLLRRAADLRGARDDLDRRAAAVRAEGARQLARVRKGCADAKAKSKARRVGSLAAYRAKLAKEHERTVTRSCVEPAAKVRQATAAQLVDLRDESRELTRRAGNMKTRADRAQGKRTRGGENPIDPATGRRMSKHWIDDALSEARAELARVAEHEHPGTAAVIPAAALWWFERSKPRTLLARWSRAEFQRRQAGKPPGHFFESAVEAYDDQRAAINAAWSASAEGQAQDAEQEADHYLEEREAFEAQEAEGRAAAKAAAALLGGEPFRAKVEADAQVAARGALGALGHDAQEGDQPRRLLCGECGGEATIWPTTRRGWWAVKATKRARARCAGAPF